MRFSSSVFLSVPACSWSGFVQCSSLQWKLVAPFCAKVRMSFGYRRTSGRFPKPPVPYLTAISLSGAADTRAFWISGRL